jgi:hypothetical protein
MSHHVIDAQISADISFELNKFCSNHKDMVLDFYCSDHDDICCKSCIEDVHRTCGKIKPLSQSLQYLTATEDFVALRQGSQSCDEEAISFLKLNANV